MTKPTPNLSPLRAQFLALQETDAQGRPYVYFDGPGGAQAPQVVLDGMTGYLTWANANKGGQFITSRRSDEIITEARQSLAEVDRLPAALREL